ncbi:restriction endonuclease subunit S [Thermocrinis sp.]
MRLRWETEFKETEIGEIPREWEVRKLGEIATISTGGTPSRRIKEYWDGGINWLKSQEINDNYIYDTEERITEDGMKNSNARKIYPPGTLLVALYAAPTAGRAAILKTFSTINQAIAAIESENNEFLFYSIIGNRERLLLCASGAAQQNLNLELLRNFPIPLPPLPEQSRIATVLSWFDDLIENKRKQNEILEKTAMAIFKNWFVDFEPFKDGEFVYNEELGKEIPKGWEVKRIINFGNIVSGRGRYLIEALQGIYPLWGANGVLGYIENYDLEGFSIVTGRVGTLGNVFLVDGKFAISDNVLCIIPNQSSWIFFLYLWMKSQVDFESLNVGTSQPLITKTALGNEPIIVPPSSILQSFHSLVEPLFQKIILNQKQIMTLRKIRDTLLPLLVFGKLRVEEL